MLSDSIGERVRSIARDALSRAAYHNFREFQCTCKRGYGTDFAAHSVRSFFHWAGAQGKASATLFVAVKHAYYCTVRQLCANVGSSDEEIAWLFKTMKVPPSVLHSLAELLAKPSLLTQWNVDSFLEATVGEMFEDTWFSTQGAETVMRTLRSSRPGDPLADITFGIILADILSSISSIMKDEQLVPKVSWDGKREIGHSSCESQTTTSPK